MNEAFSSYESDLLRGIISLKKSDETIFRLCFSSSLFDGDVQ